MAPSPEQHGSRDVSALRTSSLGNRFLSDAVDALVNPIRRATPGSSNDAKAGLETRILTARSSTMDGGQIAGAVVGSVVGGAVFFLVAGFLFFRYRRKRRQAAQDSFLPAKTAAVQRRVSFPPPDYPADQPGASQRERPQSIKDGPSERDGPVLGDGTVLHQSPTTAEGPGLVGDGHDLYTHAQSNQGGFPDDFDLSSPRRTSGPFSSTQPPTSPLEYTPTGPGASNADYYNTSIAMDSDPEQGPMAPPSRQMTELYQEQLRMSREKRKSSKGSAFSRVLKNFKRKRSSRVSDVGSDQTSQPSAPAVRQPDVPLASIEGQYQPQKQWVAGPDSPAPTGAFYAEPQEISDGTDVEQHQDKRSRFHGASQDNSGMAPHRLDSLRTALNTEPTPDPQLPSSALGRVSASPTGPYPPLISQIAARENYRLNSPDIPSPMNVGGVGFSADIDASALRGSHSPPLAPETFVDPMAIMKPTTDTEKAAYNQNAWERWQSNSPPVDAPSPLDMSKAPEEKPVHLNGAHANVDDDEDMEDDTEGEESEEEMESDAEMGDTAVESTAGAHTHLPYDGPSDYSTPPGQSSTNPSSGRTPDTRITPSPSPNNQDFIKPENSTSPEALNGSSPDKTGLTCEMCGRTFDQIHKLNHHKRYHDRKHTCPYDGCDKRFGTKTHLDRHINDKHEKKKGFHCTEPSCPYFYGGKAFPRKDNWRRHMQNKHGVNPPTGAEPAPGYPA